jgi:predicted ABC-type ATPase
VAQARVVAHRTTFYDNSSPKPFRVVAVFDHGSAITTPAWPAWAPPELR